jgi:cyclopropane fatty-acyl-phospholipid synthase-like methyltransferase
MAQIENNIRSILKQASIYNLFQWCVGADKARMKCVRDFVCPTPHMRVLDIGCGPGKMIEYFPDTIEYYGFDFNQNYIDHARREYGDRGTFICSDVNDADLLKNLPECDVVMAIGLVHHLEDIECVKLFDFAKKQMKKGGRLITFDGCYTENQSKIAKFLLDHDRGQNIRTQEGYESLAKESFKNIKTTIANNLMRLPYTFIIMECS